MKILQLFFLIALFISCSPEKETHQATYLQTEDFAKRGLPFSEAVQYGDVLYLSGQIGDLNNELIPGGVGPETNQAMKNIQSVLERNGSSMDNIIKCTCMLVDINDWAAMSAEYVKFFPNHKPARSAFATTGLALGARVEIECLAYAKK
ncbi:MAG: RidA family protein [Cyclobacteriaceae bacterium]|jgi:2-iminobutanoate/2-iminopropanoate deaminase|nr:RidA family protein [Cyclobacteriaceae bacterium]